MYLSISTILIFTNGSKRTKLGYLSLLDDLPSSSRLDPKLDPPSLTPTSAKQDLDARALETTCEGFRITELKQSPTNILIRDLKLKSQDY